jgi:hypothetical protein
MRQVSRYEVCGQDNTQITNDSQIIICNSYLHPFDQITIFLTLFWLVSLGECGSGHKAQQAKKNGAIGIVIVNSVLYNIESGIKPDTTAGLSDFPMVDLVPKSKYNAFVKAIKDGESIYAVITPGL